MDATTFKLAAGVSMPRAALWAPLITAAMDEFDVDTFQRQADFVAQVGHESGGYAFVREVWGPTPAQAKYEGRIDLGNVYKGDGSLYRGRGLIQITGRANYTAAAKALGLDIVRNPQLLELDANAARSAGWFWKTHGCNEIADTGDFVALTHRINGGTNGLADRVARRALARRALGLP